MKKIIILVVLLASILLTGCTKMTMNEMSFSTIGFADPAEISQASKAIERARINKMVENKKITPAQGVKMILAVNSAKDLNTIKQVYYSYGYGQYAYLVGRPGSVEQTEAMLHEAHASYQAYKARQRQR